MVWVIEFMRYGLEYPLPGSGHHHTNIGSSKRDLRYRACGSGGVSAPYTRDISAVYKSGALSRVPLSYLESLIKYRQSQPGDPPSPTVDCRNIAGTLKTLNERYRLFSTLPIVRSITKSSTFDSTPLLAARIHLQSAKLDFRQSGWSEAQSTLR